jgi:hypothetical protein
VSFEKNRDRLWLGKTSQIPKITVWAKRIMYIAITQLFWVGADNNQGTLVGVGLVILFFYFDVSFL